MDIVKARDLIVQTRNLMAEYRDLMSENSHLKKRDGDYFSGQYLDNNKSAMGAHNKLAELAPKLAELLADAIAEIPND